MIVEFGKEYLKNLYVSGKDDKALKGDRTGTYSVRANGKYRVEFTLVETQSEPIITVCRIIELSNHYK